MSSLVPALLAVAAGLLVIAVVATVAGDVSAVDWPEEDTPLHVRDNRSHDLELTHLARLVRASDPRALHAMVESIVDRLVGTAAVMSGPAGTDPRAVLPDQVRRFLADPPLGSAEEYRRGLVVVLDRIEAL